MGAKNRKTLRRAAIAAVLVLAAAAVLKLMIDSAPLPPTPPAPETSEPVVLPVAVRPVAPGVSAPREEAAPPAPDPAEPQPMIDDERIEVTVRDIVDGRPLSDLHLSFDPPMDTALTNERGVIHVRPTALQSARIDGGEWRILNLIGPARDLNTIWACRQFSVQGTVRAVSDLAELDLTLVKISYFAVGEKEPGATPYRDALDLQWFDRHRINRRLDVCKVEKNGAFTLTLPKIPGLAISAVAPGWSPDTVAVERLTDPCRVALVLRKRSFRLTGVVCTEQGDGIAGAIVQGFVVVRIPADQLRPEEYQGSGHGYALRVNRKENTAILVYLLGARTGADGSFEYESNVKGDLVLFVSPSGGLRSTLVSAGSLTSDVGDLRVVLPRGDGKTIQFRNHGVPLSKEEIGVSILSSVAQPTTTRVLDADGRLAACVLIPGQNYSFRLTRQMANAYYFTWDGQTQIDIDKLPKRPPWPLAR